MKKTLAFIVSVLIVMTMSISAFAAGSVAITAIPDSKTAKAGDTVSVNVNISGDASIAQLTVSLSYDENAFTLTNQENGDVFATQSTDFASAKNHPYVAAATVPNGTLFSMTFKVIEPKSTYIY